MTNALVLGGGGVGGIAWMAGVIHGLAEAGTDLTDADLFVGTSAGSTVAAYTASGRPPADLYERQVDPARQSAEIDPRVDLAEFGKRFGAVLEHSADRAQLRRAVGALALETETVPEATRRAAIISRLDGLDWPDSDLKIVAVEAETGETRVFDRHSGVSLLDAVTASGAVPGVWPPTTIGGKRFVDGGVRSNDNADLASGHSRVTVISPLGENDLIPTDLSLEATTRDLRAAGAVVAIITPDAASRAAFGANPLDPASRVPAAKAGFAQGRALRLEWT